MLEVVFDNSIAGSLKCAKGRRSGEKSVVARGLIYAGEQRPPHPAPVRQEARTWQGADLPGTSGEVAPLVLALDMGDLSDLDTAEKAGRKALLADLYGPLPAGWDQQDFDDSLEEDWQKNLETLSRLETAKQTGEAVRVWAADWCPGDVCGLYHVCDLLRSAELPVSVVWAPREKVRPNGTMVTYRGIGEFGPEEVGELAAGAVLLAPIQRRACANRWRELVAENAPLRAVVNGRLMSVEEDYYDFALRRALPETPVRAANLIGDALSRLPGVGDVWLYRRILAMLAAGELRQVDFGDPDRPYSAMVERA